MTWVSLNAQWAIASGALHFEHKPMSVDNCPYSYDIYHQTPANATFTQEPEYEFFY